MLDTLQAYNNSQFEGDGAKLDAVVSIGMNFAIEAKEGNIERES